MKTVLVFSFATALLVVEAVVVSTLDASSENDQAIFDAQHYPCGILVDAQYNINVNGACDSQPNTRAILHIELVDQGLAVFEDNPDPASGSWYGSKSRRAESSEADHDISGFTPASEESRTSGLVAIAPPLGMNGYSVSEDEETKAVPTSIAVWEVLYCPFGALANGDYKLNIELVGTKSDIRPAHYSIYMHGICTEFTLESHEFVDDITMISWQPDTPLSGSRKRRDSISQHTKTVDFASQKPFQLAHFAYSAFEDDQWPVYYQTYAGGNNMALSETELDTVEPTPTSADATLPVLETPTPTPHTNGVHAEL
ncbi:hypothetical protein DL89DRAFT_288477 [Linderina pennispora]|uniref:Uncharacterized protein n=1 Tax=Linderina pennispora TaxID=61395 RepID=A0A1Y1VSH3_9FUNG|nr:uncharacterized protein DL89DRAFT_288477 [Linderina pennispora]ORX64217.1 hypothetical protein DL89DRAFT_288477 [Linderina pennispora]